MSNIQIAYSLCEFLAAFFSIKYLVVITLVFPITIVLVVDKNNVSDLSFRIVLGWSIFKLVLNKILILDLEMVSTLLSVGIDKFFFIGSLAVALIFHCGEKS